MSLSPVFDLPEPVERMARLREARVTALLLLGQCHPATAALSAAIVGRGTLADALAAIDELPTLQRRRLLAVLAAILPAS